MVGGGRPVREVRSQTWFPVGYPGRAIRGLGEIPLIPSRCDAFGPLALAFIVWAMWPAGTQRQMRLF